MTIMTRANLEAEGISSAHASSLLDVAKREDYVILTRTPGPTCLAPLAEGYDAKGFHIKAKSCDWGPWQGFILAEPLFNKSGLAGAGANLKSNVASLTGDFEAHRNAARPPAERKPVHAGLVHLEISEARFTALFGPASVPQGHDTHTGFSKLPGGATTVQWMMKYRPKQRLWALYYDPSSLPRVEPTHAIPAADLARYQASLDPLVTAAAPPAIGSYKPVLALTNPYPAYTHPDERHKNALTGDFDLFAVWPRRGSPHAAEFDVRVAGMSQALSDQAIFQREREHAIGSVVGNISDGVYRVAQLLNQAMGTDTGHPLVNRIFHSDEGGRPSMNEIDASVAFHPDGKSYMLPANRPEFAEFALQCAHAGYVIYLNKGWQQLLEQMLGPARWAQLEPKISWQTSVTDAPARPTR